ncbi:hypothetical protein FLK61_36545 [Paenalkalicoccus suaedae]|uniref:LppX_LprAFG lipoprotein n=1 Tax=Paenalkalicoccus suaedae TaxID=2592382 RepID=A0A859FH65_9BACI|nr:DUF6612 family protein [Paenalkalicoccus suaedae]QKS72168.1 hypothetical protein FLK61_36545 [Paenalkalicoccus suaedae]
MKKLLVLSGVSLLTLAACNTEDAQDVESILTSSIEAMEEVESYAADMEMTQTMGMGDGESLTMTSTGEMIMSNNPLALEQRMEMDMGEMNMGEGPMAYTAYFSEEEGFFMEEPTLGGWIKLPESEMDAILQMEQMSPQEQLRPLQSYISELSLETTDDEYIITLSGEDIDMNAFMQEFQGLGVEGMDEMMEVMEEIDVSSLNYVIHIDKETNYQTEAQIDMVMSMDMMGQSFDSEQSIHMLFRDFNEVGPVEIPQEVIDNAQDLEDMMDAEMDFEMDEDMEIEMEEDVDVEEDTEE